MSNERKILYVSTGINFVIGITLGIILFFCQIRSGGEFPQNMYEYEREVSVADFLRMVWIDLLWFVSVVIAYGILKARLIHPAIVIRGCISSFSVLYVLSVFGIKEMLATIIPQCFTILPMLIIFSAETVSKQISMENKASGISVKKSEIIGILALSVLSAGAEVLIFKAFCTYLF